MGEILKNLVIARIKSEVGMTTAEYAVGTVAAAGLGGVLLKLLSSSQVQDLIWKIIQHAFGFLFGA